MKRRLTIWSTFVIFIFCILLATITLSFFLYMLALNLRVLETLGDKPFFGSEPFYMVLFILFISVILGTIMSAFAGKKMMKVIFELRDATKRVAAGDFSVRIKHGRMSDMNILIEDFNKMVQDLGSIETLKNDFITSVSHEIKTPIASIEGCLELLKEQTLTEEELKEYISLMELSVKRLSILTSNILKLSKLENQQILPEQTEFSLDEQIRQAILVLEHKWSTKNINLNIHLNPVRVVANKELLMHVWSNLIDNAIKFSKEDGDIDVELYQADDRAYVKIIDYGIGMQEETQKHIFQKFYQGNESRSNQGNGLGLAIVTRIVELSGGDITVESQFSKGSVFTVELPIIAQTIR